MTKAERIKIKLHKAQENALKHRERKMGRDFPLQESSKPVLKGTNKRGSTSRKSR